MRSSEASTNRLITPMPTFLITYEIIDAYSWDTIKTAVVSAPWQWLAVWKFKKKHKSDGFERHDILSVKKL